MSRKFLVPIALPADPVAAMEAATKQYVDSKAGGSSLVENGSYTPTLTGMTVGTGGAAQNSGSYTWIGLSGVGARGILSVQGAIVFGTVGPAAPSGSGRIGMPPGFNLVNVSINAPVGLVTSNHATGGSFQSMLWGASATTVRPISQQTNGASAHSWDFDGNNPSTWVAGDSIHWHLTQEAVRV